MLASGPGLGLARFPSTAAGVGVGGEDLTQLSARGALCYCKSAIVRADVEYQSAKLTTSPTLADQAYVLLRRQISEGELGAGQRVTERQDALSRRISPDLPLFRVCGRM